MVIRCFSTWGTSSPFGCAGENYISGGWDTDMTQSSRESQKPKAVKRRRKSKPEKLEFVQPFLPVKEIRNGIVETTDGRYIKILEIEPINFMLRSSEEQFNIHILCELAEDLTHAAPV